MKVTLSKSGGFAAGIRWPSKTVDKATLSPAQSTELANLVRAAAAEATEAPEGPGRTRDAMNYKITIEHEGKTTVLRQSDGSLSGSFLALRDWVQKNGEKPDTKPKS